MIALAAVLAAAVAPPGPVDFTAQTMRMEPRERRTLLDGAHAALTNGPPHAPDVLTPAPRMACA